MLSLPCSIQLENRLELEKLISRLFSLNLRNIRRRGNFIIICARFPVCLTGVTLWCFVLSRLLLFLPDWSWYSPEPGPRVWLMVGGEGSDVIWPGKVVLQRCNLLENITFPWFRSWLTTLPPHSRSSKLPKKLLRISRVGWVRGVAIICVNRWQPHPLTDWLTIQSDTMLYFGRTQTLKQARRSKEPSRLRHK